MTHGILLVDKESGVTSHDVVADVRRLLNTREVGHGGTLDPLATGLLICLVGEATKLSSYVMSEEKSYRVGVKLGLQTDSGDITGQVISEKDATGVSRADLDKCVAGLVGVLSLPVPKYSAVKVKGKKLYEYARNNEDVQIPAKDMTIKRAEILDFSPGVLVIDLDCEKGTYVRSWVERLGELLGCGATVESLRRLKSGPFTVEACRKISDYQAMSGSAMTESELHKSVVALPHVLGGWPALKVLGRDLGLVRNGQIPNAIFTQLLHVPWTQGVRLLTPEGDLLALVVRDAEKGLKLARVFNSRS